MEHDGEELIAHIRARLEREPEVGAHRRPVSLFFDHGDLVLEGEVESVAAKKLALEAAAGEPGIDGIIDRLRVAPAERMPDGEILDRTLRVLSEDSALQELALYARWARGLELVRSGAPRTQGQIRAQVEAGVVTLDGDVPSLAHKRLAESLAWWVPGTRDVVNGLGVTPDEDDSDDEISDSLAMVLQKDPLLKGLKVGVRTEGRVVTLVGVVHSEEQRRAAEHDGWCLFGVDRVVNLLEVRQV